MPIAPTCLCGTCRKCKRREAVQRHRANDRERAREVARAYYAANLERERERDRKRGYRGDPEKNKTRCLSRRLHPEPQPCEVCGAEGQRHHDDYSKPDQIRWLCRTHHAIEHRVHA